MKFTILLVLCSSIFAITLAKIYVNPPTDPFGFNNPNTSNRDMKVYFVKYVNKLTGINPNVLQAKSPNQLVALAIDGLQRRLQKQPEHAGLIREHLQYFDSYRNMPVPHSPFVDLNKDLSKLPEPELRVYLIGYLHALTEVDEHELNNRSTKDLIILILDGLRERFESNKNAEVADLIMLHYNYFQRLRQKLYPAY